MICIFFCKQTFYTLNLKKIDEKNNYRKTNFKVKNFEKENLIDFYSKKSS